MTVSFSGFIAVGIGGALGCWLRWVLAAGLNTLLPTLPPGTLTVNLVGGYLIGVAVAVFEQNASLSPELRLFIITGFLGGLTTFSTFSAESVGLLITGRYGWALAHTTAHLAGSIFMTVLGIQTIKLLR
jgi:fluoride exporter